MVVYFQRFPGFVPLPYFDLDFSFSSSLLCLSHSILISLPAVSPPLGPWAGRSPSKWQIQVGKFTRAGLLSAAVGSTRFRQCWLLFLHFDNSVNTCCLFRDSPILRSIGSPVARNLLWFFPNRCWLWLEEVCPHSYIVRFLVMLWPSVLL